MAWQYKPPTSFIRITITVGNPEHKAKVDEINAAFQSCMPFYYSPYQMGHGARWILVTEANPMGKDRHGNDWSHILKLGQIYAPSIQEKDKGLIVPSHLELFVNLRDCFVYVREYSGCYTKVGLFYGMDAATVGPVLPFEEPVES